jgi:hypothetical protein
MLKKIILLYSIFGLYTNLFAQTIPNGGFEEWWNYPNTIYETPKNWTDNDLLYQHFDPGYRGITTIKTTRSHSGKYALQMGISIDHGDTVNGGIYSTGNVDSLLRVIYHINSAGFPCSQRYLSFGGFYVFNCQLGDTAVFGAILTRWNWVTRKRDTIVNSILRIGDYHPDYVPFVVPLKYRIKKEVPDTAFLSVGIQSQLKRGAMISTFLIIDDLAFSGREEDERQR